MKQKKGGDYKPTRQLGIPAILPVYGNEKNGFLYQIYGGIL